MILGMLQETGPPLIDLEVNLIEFFKTSMACANI